MESRICCQDTVFLLHNFFINFSVTTRFGYFFVARNDFGLTHLRLSFSFDFITILKTFEQKTLISNVFSTYWQETVKKLIKKKISVKKLFAILNAYISTRITLSFHFISLSSDVPMLRNRCLKSWVIKSVLSSSKWMQKFLLYLTMR